MVIIFKEKNCIWLCGGIIACHGIAELQDLKTCEEGFQLIIFELTELQTGKTGKTDEPARLPARL